MIRVKSTVIKGVGYNPLTRIMSIQFKVERYDYNAVPFIVFLKLLFSRSRGGKFNELVKGNYKFVKR
jgi:hypothetical protein